MAQKTAGQFSRDFGIRQLFAQYQAPTDNAWTESWFRILKYDWLRVKDYFSFEELKHLIGHLFGSIISRGIMGSIDSEQRHTERTRRFCQKELSRNVRPERAVKKRQARKSCQETSGQKEAFGDKWEKEKPICLVHGGLNMVVRPYLIFPKSNPSVTLDGFCRSARNVIQNLIRRML